MRDDMGHDISIRVETWADEAHAKKIEATRPRCAHPGCKALTLPFGSQWMKFCWNHAATTKDATNA